MALSLPTQNFLQLMSCSPKFRGTNSLFSTEVQKDFELVHKDWTTVEGVAHAAPMLKGVTVEFPHWGPEATVSSKAMLIKLREGHKSMRREQALSSTHS